MLIIQADTKHLQLVASLFNKYRIFYKQNPNIDAAQKFIEARLRNKDSIILLALDNNEDSTPMGFVQLYPTFSSLGMQKIYVLNDLYVDEKCRKIGVGTALMEKAKEIATAEGAAMLTLSTQSTNKNALDLYSKLGYKEDKGFMSFYLDLQPKPPISDTDESDDDTQPNSTLSF